MTTIINLALQSVSAKRIQRVCRKVAIGACAVSAASMLFGSTANADPIGVSLNIEMLRALQTTKERNVVGTPRDEVYITVNGFTSNGRQIDFRIPSSSIEDDYLGFKKGQIATAANPNSWLNQNSFLVHSPQLYEGVLENEGDSVFLLVTFQEQDNATIGEAKDVSTAIFGACENVAEGVGTATKDPTTKAVGKACGAAKKLAGLLPSSDSHEDIGSLAIQITNVDGRPQTVFLPANGELAGGSKAKTTIIGTRDDAVGLITTGSVAIDRVTLDMIDNEETGRYWTTIAVKTVDPAEVVPGHYRLNNDDVERGTCRGGKDVSLRHPNGSFRPIDAGQAINMEPDGNRDIEYICSRSMEVERNLFQRPYDKFAVQRTHSKVNYYPYDLVPFEVASIPGRTSAGLRAEVAAIDFPVAKGVSRKELQLSGLSNVRPSKKPTKARSCSQLMARNWDRSTTLPLVHYWSARNIDNALMVHPQWRGCPGHSQSPDYRSFKIEGLLFKSKATAPFPTVPLHHYWSHNARDNALVQSLLVPGLPKAQEPSGYRYYRTAGYVIAPWVKPNANMLPLYTLYSPNRRDFFTTTQSNYAGRPGERKGEYIFVRLEGYVLKAQ